VSPLTKPLPHHAPYIFQILQAEASDGSKGVTSIKNVRGMVIAQKLTSCEHNSMPLHAIKTGAVAYELLPSEIPFKHTETK
jgi:two-component system CheB/CheR fusion protein